MRARDGFGGCGNRLHNWKPGSPQWEAACVCQICNRRYLFPILSEKSGGKRRCRACRFESYDRGHKAL